MTASTKRKHVLAELLQSKICVPRDGQEIVRVMASCGNNLHDAKSAMGDTFLITMPNKFRKNVWIKRGDYVLVERIPEGNKVKAEIITVLTRDHIKFFKNQNCWPEQFQEEDKKVVNSRPSYVNSSSSSTSSDED